MFTINTLSILLALTSSTFAVPAPFTSSTVVESLNGPPAGWSKDESVTFDKDASIVELRINLVRQGVQEFQDLAINVRINFLFDVLAVT